MNEKVKVVRIPYNSSIRDVNEKKESSQINESQNNQPKRGLQKWHKILIIFTAILTVGITIFLIIKLIQPREKPPNNPPPEDSTKQSPKNQILSKEEAIKAFEPSFIVASKSDKLNQLLMKTFDKQISISNGFNSSYTYFTKGIFDIYTLNETTSDEKDKEFYSKKYCTVITINSICQDFTGKINDCDLKRYLNLNIKNRRNLGSKDEVDREKLKNFTLPICIIEHSETNIIISVKCPESLSLNFKNDIILAFQSIKPETFKGLGEDQNVRGTTTNVKDDKIYINSFTKYCEDYDGDPTKNQTCETNKNIITDKDGNLISMNKTSIEEMIQDENNYYYKSQTYLFEDISNQNSDNFNPSNYKSNLEIVFNLIEPLMKKESYIPNNFFQEVLENLMYENSNETIPTRRLTEDVSGNFGIKEENIFSKNINGLNLAYSLKNDIGNGYGEPAKAISSYITGNEVKEFSHDESYIKLNETLSRFLSVSKAANVLLNILYGELNEPFLSLRSNINENIQKLNDLLAFVSLSDIFDSTLAIDGLDLLPKAFVSCSQELYDNFSQMNNDIAYSINDYKILLKERISSFLTESHKLLNYIFSNLTETSNILSSEKSYIAEVSSYYLNNTDTSYVDIIKRAKEIIETYFINEKELILPLINNMLNKFGSESLDSIKSIQSIFDTLTDNLVKGNLSINDASNEEINSVIENIDNSKNKVNEIIENVIEIFNKSIGLQENGYFETQKYINDGNKSYIKVAEEAMKIAKDLDNNLLIDKTFDNIMTYFRDQFIVLLKNMETSKRQKFPLKENILSNSIFSESKIKEINNALEKEKGIILNFIKDENKGYLSLIEQTLDNFKKENQNTLELTISNIQVLLSKLNLNNLDSKYNELLNLTQNSINNILNNNINLAIQYLTKVKDMGSTHCTQAYKNKYIVYLDNLNTIRNYIRNDLKNELTKKYKNVITNIRAVLQTIKSNDVIKKYYNSLSFSESHLNVINELFSRLDKYISDTLFNSKYLPTINSYITTTINSLNSIEKKMNNLYSQVYKLTYTNSNYDYFKQLSNCWRCCKSHFLWCWSYGTCCNYYYQGYHIDITNNHLKLQNINFAQYSINFDSYFSDIYTPLKNNITSYCSTINKISDPLDAKKNEILSNNVNYLKNISETILTILHNDLNINLFNQSYLYFQSELIKQLPTELNKSLQQWKDVFEKVDDDLKSNISEFQSNIGEFGKLCLFYYQTYKQNISYEYVNSLVEQSKNDLNYTIKFYYNLMLSKINKTYSYILNNIPINDKPFDEILNQRIKEIMNSYNNLLNQFQTSRDSILSAKKQLSTLKVNEDNFFSIDYITNDNADKIEEEISIKCTQLIQTGRTVENNERPELIVAKFYLENGINGKQIKEVNEPIRSATFIDLQTDVFQNLIDEIYEIEQDELIRNIKNSLIEFNERLIKNFKYEKEKYTELIQEKIYKEFYTKENLENTIISFYKNGLINLDEQSKNIIVGYMDEVINNIKAHISNEAQRINDGLTSYSTNYNTFQQTLNNYKNKIYNQFYTAVISVANDFHNELLNKFYINYIEKYLEELERETQKEKFEEKQFLNISFNLKEIMNETVGFLINDYKNVSKIQINYLHDKNIQQLEELFAFSTTIKTKINNEIDNIYNSTLLPVLKKEAIYNPGDVGVTDYDFPIEITNNISNFLSIKIQQTNIIINEMKGNNSIINNEEWRTPGFSKIKNEIFSKIKTSFQEFYNVYNYAELEVFKNIVFNNVNNNFKIFVKNFIPTFGKDFFDRILKYNEIQKIKSLYYNLKYSLIETLIYYIQLCSTYKSQNFPEDLKYKILTLNDLDSIVRTNNDKVISTLTSKLESFFESTKNYLVEKYISHMKIDPNIEIAFNDNIKEYIRQILDGKRYVFENEYIQSINTYIKDPFIKQYSKTLNDESKDMIYFIEKNKEDVRSKFNVLFNLKVHDVLLDIEEKLNNTLKSLEAYISHFNSFSIPDEVKIFLNNFAFNIIKPNYDSAKNILDEATRYLIKENLQKNEKVFKKSYSIKDFDSKVNEINNNLTNDFNNINESLNSYGNSKIQYKEKLEKEIARYKSLRALDDLDENKINYTHNIVDTRFGETLEKIMNSSLDIQKFVDTLNLFNEFDEKLEKYNNSINYQYSISQNNIKNNIEHYDELNEVLEELFQISNQYYSKANYSYYIVKELIINSIKQINNILEKCANATYDIIDEKYIEIKNDFKTVHEINNELKSKINVKDYNATIEKKQYVIKSQIDNYKQENEFMIDIKYEEDNKKNSKVIGFVNNRNRPEEMIIDVYSRYGQDGKFGRKMNIKLNDIMLNTNINFEVDSNNVLINTTYSHDEFEIRNEFYESREIISEECLAEICFPITEYTDIKYDTPENELPNEIIKAKTTHSNETFSF